MPQREQQQAAQSELSDLVECLRLLGFPREPCLLELLLEMAANFRELCALNGADLGAVDGAVVPWLRHQLEQAGSACSLAEVLRELASWQPAAAGALLLLVARNDDAERAELLLRCGAPATCTNEIG